MFGLSIFGVRGQRGLSLQVVALALVVLAHNSLTQTSSATPDNDTMAAAAAVESMIGQGSMKVAPAAAKASSNSASSRVRIPRINSGR